VSVAGGRAVAACPAAAAGMGPAMTAGAGGRHAGERAGCSGEVGLGDAVGVAGGPLDEFGAVAVRVGDPRGPFAPPGSPGGSAAMPWAARLARAASSDPAWMTRWLMPVPGLALPCAGSPASSMVTNGSSGNWSMLRVPVRRPLDGPGDGAAGGLVKDW
jgi:hypothetical protein